MLWCEHFEPHQYLTEYIYILKWHNHYTKHIYNKMRHETYAQSWHYINYIASNIYFNTNGIISFNIDILSMWTTNLFNSWSWNQVEAMFYPSQFTFNQHQHKLIDLVMKSFFFTIEYHTSPRNMEARLARFTYFYKIPSQQLKEGYKALLRS